MSRLCYLQHPPMVLSTHWTILFFWLLSLALRLFLSFPFLLFISFAAKSHSRTETAIVLTVRYNLIDRVPFSVLTIAWFACSWTKSEHSHCTGFGQWIRIDKVPLSIYFQASKIVEKRFAKRAKCYTGAREFSMKIGSFGVDGFCCKW